MPPGWSGKLWAISEGLKHAASLAPDYLLFTDADIVHAPEQRRANWSPAPKQKSSILFRLMVKLRCRSLAETLLIPAFVFFFFMLYPPAWVARRNRSTAAAAGGCILIRPSALDRIGGIESIRGEIIDDCALARAVKRTGGRIWLGVTRRRRAAFATTAAFAEIRAMISRTAFAQLHHSTLLLRWNHSREWPSSISPRRCCSSREIRWRLIFGIGGLDPDDHLRTLPRCVSTVDPSRGRRCFR